MQSHLYPEEKSMKVKMIEFIGCITDAEGVHLKAQAIPS